jgi:FG-GAP-like repeat/FG-GAP repeat
MPKTLLEEARQSLGMSLVAGWRCPVIALYPSDGTAMLPEQRGLLSSWINRFRRSRRKRREIVRYRNVRARSPWLELLEDRSLLTATVYVDFGDRFNDDTHTVAEWATYGLAVPQGQASWITGPDFPFGNNVAITYVPFRTVMQRAANQPLVTAFDPGPNANEDPFEFSAGPLPPIDKIAAMEDSIFEMITREFAPFDMTVTSVTATNLAAVRASLFANNRVDDPYAVDGNATAMTPDPNFYNPTNARTNKGHTPPGFDPTRLDANGAPVGTRDVYIFIGGWTVNGGQQVGIVSGTNLAFSDGIFDPTAATYPTFSDPNDPLFGGMAPPGMMPPPPPTPAIPIVYADNGAAVAADTIAQLALDPNLVDPTTNQPLVRFNTAVANLATQVGALTYGGQYNLTDAMGNPVLDPVTMLPITETMEHSSSGEASIGNPFFDADVDLLTGSDVMREGPQELGMPFPSLDNVSVFSRFPMMVGDTNQDPTFTQNSYDYMVNLTDWIGPAPGVGYVTGTGAPDHITLVNDPNTPGMILVTVDAYRDASFDPSQLIATYSYDIDPTTITTLYIETGNNNDQVDFDPAIPGLSAIALNIFGGGGVNNFSLDDNGTDDVSISPANLDTFAFSGVERFDTQLQVTNSTTNALELFHLQEFQDNSIVHLEGFNSLTYTMPEFLGANFTVTSQAGSSLATPPSTSAVDMVIDGTAGPTTLSPVVGVANIEFTNIASFTIGAPVGNTADTVTVQSDLGFADGLQNFDVDLGPGNDTLDLPATNLTLPVPGGAFVYDGGAGVDTISTAGDTDWTLVDGTATTDGMLLCGGGGSVVLRNLFGENAVINGGDSSNNLTVTSWSGTVTLDAGLGDDTYNIGDAADPVTGTVDLSDDDGNDTININNFTGGGTLNAGSGNDVFHVNTWASTGTLMGGSGNDNFIIGTGGNLDTVTGNVPIVGGDGSDTLTLDDSTKSTAVDYTIGPNSVSKSAGTFGGVSFDSTLENVVLTGTKGKNTFFVTPSLKTTLKVNGNDPPFGTPAANGDSLIVDFTGTKGAKESSTLAPAGAGNGSWTFTDGHKPIIFTSMEQVQSLPVTLVAAAAAAGAKSKPLVNVYDATSNALVFSFYAYEQTFTGGVRVTMADVNGDGIQDVITAPGMGRIGLVEVFDGAKLIQMANAQHMVTNPAAAMIASFMPEGSAYKNGLYVATGDVNGDGHPDIVTSRSAGTTEVRVFTNNSNGTKFTQTLAFVPYTTAEKVSNGAVVSLGDVNGDGRADIVVAPGVGSVIKVKMFDGVSGALIRSFQGFESTYNKGVSLAVADVNGDGFADVMLGAGAGGGSRVRVLTSFGQLIKEFNAYTTGNINAAVSLTVRQIDNQILLYTGQSNDGRSDLIRRFNPLTGVLVDQFFDNTPDLASGVFLG